MSRAGVRVPAVSVVLRAHNAEGTLARALACLDAQTLGSLQVIVVDDASSDATARMLATAQERDPLLEVARIEADDPAVALNLGCERAQGTYLFFMDATDCMAPGTLERLYDQTRTQRLDLVAGALCFAGQDARRRDESDPAGEQVHVFRSAEEFRAQAWHLFDRGIFPYPGGKLFRTAQVRASGARFADDGGMGFATTFLRDAEGVAIVPQAVLTVGATERQVERETARGAVGADGWDAVDRLFDHWGLSDDGATADMLQRRYLNGVVESIVSLCEPTCALSEDEKRAHVQQAISSDRTQRAVAETGPWKGLVRAMLVPIRHQDVDLAMSEGKVFSWLSRHNVRLSGE